MAHARRDDDDFEALRDQALSPRAAGLSRRQIRDRIQVHNNDLLNRLLEGEPPPDRPRHPRAKDDLRARARELRLQGWTYDRIQLELGCSKSSISLWVRDLPTPERRKRTREEASAIAKRGWEVTMRLRDEERRRTKEAAAAEIGALSDRELFLLGVGLYWAEGSKTKPHLTQERVTFINSDPRMIEVYLAWLRLLGVTPDRLRLHVHIHETGDVEGAERFWTELVGTDATALGKTYLKRHKPKTNRKNLGQDYRGCLVIRVLGSAELYRRIEGWWYGIVLSAREADPSHRT
ncbi:hypothetical protein AB0454_39515 [Streptomyces sp. NPDC093509]|uniref:hypothetical protein n=1 Tax=Streptomyces sp. NPDC093509 TaxID=3154982 RepID=UPI00344FE3AD